MALDGKMSDIFLLMSILAVIFVSHLASFVYEKFYAERLDNGEIMAYSLITSGKIFLSTLVFGSLLLVFLKYLL